MVNPRETRSLTRARLRSPARALALLLAPLLLLSACAGEEGTGDLDYVAGNGQVVQFADADRLDPVELSGTTLTGEAYDLTEAAGQVVVVNIWWSGCGPCRTEMPMLTEADNELGEDVDFLGINTRDNSVEQALAFEQQRGVAYPSLYSPDGRAILAFEGRTSPKSMPTTLVLDRDHRVARMILGAIPSKRTLTAVVEEVLAENG